MKGLSCILHLKSSHNDLFNECNAMADYSATILLLCFATLFFFSKGGGGGDSGGGGKLV